MVVVFICQAYRLARSFTLYRREIEVGVKIGRTMQITDKQMMHRRSNHYECDCRRLDHAVFDTVSVGDQITEYSGKHSGIRIEVVAPGR